MEKTISIRPTKSDWINLNNMNNNCPHITTGKYAGFYWSLHHAAANGADWISASKKIHAQVIDDTSEDIPEIIRLTVNKEDFEMVAVQIREQLNLQRIKTSYLIRLVIANFYNCQKQDIQTSTSHHIFDLPTA